MNPHIVSIKGQNERAGVLKFHLHEMSIFHSHQLTDIIQNSNFRVMRHLYFEQNMHSIVPKFKYFFDIYVLYIIYMFIYAEWYTAKTYNLIEKGID